MGDSGAAAHSRVFPNKSEKKTGRHQHLCISNVQREGEGGREGEREREREREKERGRNQRRMKTEREERKR